ncbi:MAG: hypothetical protein H6926_09110 [Chromatiales bacterium]|nr:hypothetical protein [Chromatiales bacterium]
MAESWVRLWAGMTTDPKWQTIARKSGQPRALVIALFTHLMLEANEAEERGRLDGLNIEDAASALDCDEEAVEAILAAMQGRVIEDGGLSGWDKRQPKREDAGNSASGAKSAADRKREQRAREAAEQAEKSRDVTTCHDVSRDVTTRHAPEAEAEAEAEAEVHQAAAASPHAGAHEQPPVAAAAEPGDPIHVRACELTALVRNRGARLNASNPDVRSWAERGVTDAQLLTAFDLAEERRAAKGDPSPVNAGLLTVILRDVTAPQQARASPAARKANATRDQNREAIERAKARIMAAEAGRSEMHDEGVINAH